MEIELSDYELECLCELYQTSKPDILMIEDLLLLLDTNDNGYGADETYSVASFLKKSKALQYQDKYGGSQTTRESTLPQLKEEESVARANGISFSPR